VNRVGLPVFINISAMADEEPVDPPAEEEARDTEEAGGEAAEEDAQMEGEGNEVAEDQPEGDEEEQGEEQPEDGNEDDQEGDQGAEDGQEEQDAEEHHDEEQMEEGHDGEKQDEGEEHQEEGDENQDNGDEGQEQQDEQHDEQQDEQQDEQEEQNEEQAEEAQEENQEGKKDEDQQEDKMEEEPEEGDWGNQDEEDMGKEQAEEQEEEEGFKEEPEKAEEKPYEECEKDAPDDDRPKVASGSFAVSKSHSTLNVMTSCEGKMLMNLADGGFQHLVAGFRTTAGLKAGRYVFEVKIVEVKYQAESSSKQRVPRMLVGLGVGTADSSLFLGDEAKNMGFNSEGELFKDGASTWMGNRTHLQSQTILAVVLNLEPESPNANPVSFFVDGVRCGKPQALPEALKGKVLYPIVNYKNVTLHANFTGVEPFQPLPFACRTLQDAAAEDVEVKAKEEQKAEVLFPIGLPDEGTFSWLDGFLKDHQDYTELSGRALVSWGCKSGLWRPAEGGRRSCNDRPSPEFGIKPLDDGTAKHLMQSVAPVIQRNCVVMEVQKNLLANERKKALTTFDPADFKRIALVVMGEPPAEYKEKVQEQMLVEKKQKAGYEVKRSHRKRWGTQDGPEKKDLTAEEIEAEVKKAEEACELTEQEKQLLFKKPTIEDLSRKDMANSFSSFSIPTEDEGFDEIRFVWQGEEDCAEYLKKWISEKKLTQRVEELKPGAWFKEQRETWQRSVSSWKRKLEELKDPKKRPAERRQGNDEKRQRGEDDKVKPVGRQEKTETVDLVDDEQENKNGNIIPTCVEEADPWKIKDLADIGNGEPLFAKFSWEDWMLLDLRFELHVLVHAYQHDMNDPDRVSFHENHTEHYYDLYFKKQLSLKNYGVSSVLELFDMVKDTVEVMPKNSVLDPQLSNDTPFENFVKLTEDHRRARLAKLDVGDDSAALRFQRPQQQRQGHRDGHHQQHRGGYGSRDGGKGGSRGTTYSQQSRAPVGSAGGGPSRDNRGHGGGSAGGGARGASSGGYGGRSGAPPARNAPAPPRGGSSYSGSGAKRSYEQGPAGGRDSTRDRDRNRDRDRDRDGRDHKSFAAQPRPAQPNRSVQAPPHKAQRTGYGSGAGSGAHGSSRGGGSGGSYGGSSHGDSGRKGGGGGSGGKGGGGKGGGGHGARGSDRGGGGYRR